MLSKEGCEDSGAVRFESEEIVEEFGEGSEGGESLEDVFVGVGLGVLVGGEVEGLRTYEVIRGAKRRQGLKSVSIDVGSDRGRDWSRRYYRRFYYYRQFRLINSGISSKSRSNLSSY